MHVRYLIRLTRMFIAAGREQAGQGDRLFPNILYGRLQAL